MPVDEVATAIGRGAGRLVDGVATRQSIAQWVQGREETLQLILPLPPEQLPDWLADNCHLAQRRPYSQAVKSVQARTAAAWACVLVGPVPWPSWK